MKLVALLISLTVALPHAVPRRAAPPSTLSFAWADETTWPGLTRSVRVRVAASHRSSRRPDWGRSLDIGWWGRGEGVEAWGDELRWSFDDRVTAVCPAALIGERFFIARRDDDRGVTLVDELVVETRVSEIDGCLDAHVDGVTCRPVIATTGLGVIASMTFVPSTGRLVVAERLPGYPLHEIDVETGAVARLAVDDVPYAVGARPAVLPYGVGFVLVTWPSGHRHLGERPRVIAMAPEEPHGHWRRPSGDDPTVVDWSLRPWRDARR